MTNRLASFCRCAILTLTVGGSVGCTMAKVRPNSSNFTAAWESVDCETFDIPDSIAANSDCGYVSAPEEHNKPVGRSIKLAVVRVRSTSRTPAPDPLFVEQGGPGDTTIGVFVNAVLPAKFPGLLQILEKRDLIFVEERGTRYSKPFLSCPEINAHNIAVAQGQRKFTDPSWIASCHARFKAQGINLSAFNTRENASDIYFVAETLGYQQFNFYGGSYGTLLGQYVVAQADKHKSTLRSAILDGVVRPDIDFNLAFSHTISHSLRNVFRACANDQRCNQAYPNLEAKFLGLINQLNRKPIPIILTIPSSKKTINSKLNGDSLVYGILPELYRTEDEHALPKHIHAASQGDFSWILEPLSEALESDSAKEMYNTVLCARSKSIRVLPSQVLPSAYAQMLRLGRREADAVSNACKALNVDLKPPFSFENLDTPLLIFNGEFDPATPQPYGEAVAKNFKNAFVYTFPGVGHIALILKPSIPTAYCSAQIATDFLNNPNQAPNSQCINQAKPVFQIEESTPH
jgi:pimeloyl-ACP methyl ester carboxylesterase